MTANLYKEATRNCALFNTSHRFFIEVKGADCLKYLQGLLTNDIQKLKERQGCYALVLTPKGKIITDLFCYSCGDYFGIDFDVSRKEIVLETLKKYIIFQKITIEEHASWKSWTVLGPKTMEIVSQKIENLPTTPRTYTGTSFAGKELWIIHKILWGYPALEIWVTETKRASLKKELNLHELDSETAEILRIESGTPLFGVDMDENTIPQEANLYHALSFDKGCYVGQEIVARLEHRGHVGKQLVQLVIHGDIPPAKGEKITCPEGKEIGTVTSSCFSPKENLPLALGYLRYSSLHLQEVRIGETLARPRKVKE